MDNILDPLVNGVHPSGVTEIQFDSTDRNTLLFKKGDTLFTWHNENKFVVMEDVVSNDSGAGIIKLTKPTIETLCDNTIIQQWAKPKQRPIIVSDSPDNLKITKGLTEENIRLKEEVEYYKQCYEKAISLYVKTCET